MNVRTFVTCLGLVAVVGFLSGCPAPVFFRDQALESAIRAELHMPFGILTDTDLLGVVALDARGLNIRDLTGIEHCQNLQWLDLQANAISNLKPLEQLGRPESPFDSPLVYLNLNSNDITDITPLVGLMNLQGLLLFDNQVADIQALVTNAEFGGLGEGDYVVLDFATLNEKALTIDIPKLESYGVNVVQTVPAE